jgi:hypothetical protein
MTDVKSAAFDKRVARCSPRTQTLLAFLRTAAANSGDHVGAPTFESAGIGVTYWVNERRFCRFDPKHEADHVWAMVLTADRAGLAEAGVVADRQDGPWVTISHMRGAVRLVPHILRACDAVASATRQQRQSITKGSPVAVSFLRHRSADSVRHLLRNFADSYKDDWARWQTLTSSSSLAAPEAVAEFKRILGRWQAVRPRPLASADALTALITGVSPELERLASVDLRNLRQLNATQEAALLSLWDQVEARAAARGLAGCVGITKVVMLLTAGRIGPALDSRVRKGLGLRSVHDGSSWLTALKAISEDLNEFESRTGATIDQLVERRWRPVSVGRAYDMAAGPRPAGISERLG